MAQGRNSLPRPLPWALGCTLSQLRCVGVSAHLSVPTIGVSPSGRSQTSQPNTSSHSASRIPDRILSATKSHTVRTPPPPRPSPWHPQQRLRPRTNVLLHPSTVTQGPRDSKVSMSGEPHASFGRQPSLEDPALQASRGVGISSLGKAPPLRRASDRVAQSRPEGRPCHKRWLCVSQWHGRGSWMEPVGWKPLCPLTTLGRLLSGCSDNCTRQ